MYLEGPTEEYFELRVLDNNDCEVIKESIESSLSILWFQDDQSELKIDGSFSENLIGIIVLLLFIGGFIKACNG